VSQIRYKEDTWLLGYRVQTTKWKVVCGLLSCAIASDLDGPSDTINGYVVYNVETSYFTQLILISIYLNFDETILWF